MKNTGKIIVLAFPDTFVNMSTEWICKVLPIVGLGTREYIKAGHAALVLIENETGKAAYYDFGRYVTPNGFGRVRGANTDAEVEIPIQALFGKDGTLENLNEFLLWLNAYPEKTHGEGRLIASVCDQIDYQKAQAYITELQSQGSIRYAAFGKTGSNCSRFVTDTLLAAANDEKMIKALQFNKKFTPSTVGNVEKAAKGGQVYEVFNGQIETFKGTALKENLKNYFGRKKATVETIPQEITLGSNAQKLTGTGSDAWFELSVDVDVPENHYLIKRYNNAGLLDFEGIFYSEEFNSAIDFQFTYDSHCEFCHVIQEGKKIKLDCVEKTATINLSQTVHSA